MAASAAMPGRRASTLKLFTVWLEVIDTRLPMIDIIEKAIYITATMMFFYTQPPPGSINIGFGFSITREVLFSVAVFIYMTLLSYMSIIISNDQRRDKHIAPRLRAVIVVYIAEMNNVLAIMKLWERQTYKEDGNSTKLLTTATRLHKFLTAMDSMDLNRKIHDLKISAEELNTTQISPGSLLRRIFNRCILLPNTFVWMLYVSPKFIFLNTDANGASQFKTKNFMIFGPLLTTYVLLYADWSPGFCYLTNVSANG